MVVAWQLLLVEVVVELAATDWLVVELELQEVVVVVTLAREVVEEL